MGKLSNNASGGRFFTNALDTKTKGLDVTARYGVHLGMGTLRLTAAMNFNQADITNRDQITTPVELQAVTSTPIIGRVEHGRFERGQPKSSWNFIGSYIISEWSIMIREVRFGEVTIYNSNAARDQTLSPVWTTDAELSYNLLQGVTVAVGANNLFDTYPNKILKVNSFNGIFHIAVPRHPDLTDDLYMLE